MSAAAKLAAFGAILVIVFFAGLGLGDAFAPEPAPEPAPTHTEHSP